jgi:hypothetical protein
MGRRGFAAALVALASLAVAAPASGDDERSLNQIALNSDLIVVGHVVRTTQVERDNDLEDIAYNHTHRYTAIIALIAVDETLKGDAAQTVKFTYPKQPRVPGEQVYDLGQDGVWLLRKSEKPGEYLADEKGRFQPRERKEQVRAILNAAKTQKGQPDDSGGN